jgi:golgi SNAP receptor complex member 2
LNDLIQLIIHRRVKDFRADLLSLRAKFDSLKRLHSDSVLTVNRNELFGRRGFQSATPENPYDASRIRTNSGLTREEGMFRENDFLKRTEGQLDDFIGRGMAVLDNLVEQRGFLKVI